MSTTAFKRPTRRRFLARSVAINDDGTVAFEAGHDGESGQRLPYHGPEDLARAIAGAVTHLP